SRNACLSSATFLAKGFPGPPLLPLANLPWTSRPISSCGMPRGLGLWRRCMICSLLAVAAGTLTLHYPAASENRPETYPCRDRTASDFSARAGPRGATTESRPHQGKTRSSAGRRLDNGSARGSVEAEPRVAADPALEAGLGS